MTDESQLNIRYARLNAARDLQRPMEQASIGTPTVSPLRGKDAVSAAQKDRLVPRSAREQAAFEARQAEKDDSDVKPSFAKRALKFVWLVIREIGVMFWEGMTKRRSGKCYYPDTTYDDSYERRSNPAYSYLVSNIHHRPSDWD